MVNLVSPVAPTRLANPPRGTRELVEKNSTIIKIGGKVFASSRNFVERTY